MFFFFFFFGLSSIVQHTKPAPFYFLSCLVTYLAPHLVAEDFTIWLLALLCQLFFPFILPQGYLWCFIVSVFSREVNDHLIVVIYLVLCFKMFAPPLQNVRPQIYHGRSKTINLSCWTIMLWCLFNNWGCHNDTAILHMGQLCTKVNAPLSISNLALWR